MSIHYSIVPAVKKTARLISLMGDDDPIFVLAHKDADGISAASIIGQLLALLEKPFVIRFLRQIRTDLIESIAEELIPYNLIILDMGSNQLRTIIKVFKRAARVVIIDHHVPGKKPNFIPFKLVHLNLRLFGSGKNMFSSSSTSYLIARAFLKYYPSLKDAVKPAILGALGDRQDIGEKRSLIGINKLIVEEGKKFGIISEKIDLLIPGRSTRPVFQALADIYNPIIPGITGSPEGVYKLLVSLGILKEEITYQMVTWNELKPEHQKKIFEVLAQRLISSGNYSFDEINNLLLGTMYEFINEKNPIKKDAREYTTLLNATARMGQPYIGVATIWGDEESEKRAEMLLKQYHHMLSNMLKIALDNVKKIDNMIIIDGRSKIKEDFIPVIASILANSFRDATLVLAFSESENNMVKISIRRPANSPVSNVNNLITKAINGLKNASGGGHENAGGAFLLQDHVEIFIERLRRLIS